LSENSSRVWIDKGAREAGSGGKAQPGQTMNPAAHRAPATKNAVFATKRFTGILFDDYSTTPGLWIEKQI
jgi:hypothetical protein